MKKLLLLGIVVFFSSVILPQSIPNLPIAIGVGSAEVWGDSIYHFGGGSSWSGSTRYAVIYKFDGTSWQNYASMPDNDVWGISTARKGDTVFVYGGYNFGNNKLRIYNFVTNTWVYAANSPNISSTYGHTMEYLDGFVYMFFNGYVYKYNVNTNSWTQGTTLSQNGSWLFSTIYQDEIYLVGWTLSKFYKYTPSTDQWTQLADLPYFVTGGSLKTVDDKIYYVGGTSGSGGGTFNNTLVYDIATNQWSDASIFISANRAYMADVYYKSNFYVIGGLDNSGNAVSDVEFIIAGTPSGVETHSGTPGGFQLSQNYPNPFNPSTTISFSIPSVTLSGVEGFRVQLKVYDVLGNEVATLVNEEKPAGVYEVEFNASRLSSGIYFYKLQAGSFTQTKKMTLIK